MFRYPNNVSQSVPMDARQLPSAQQIMQLLHTQHSNG